MPRPPAARRSCHSGSRQGCSADLGDVEIPARLTISTCVGCGSMREFASCEGVCRERQLEVVSGGDYDELVAAAKACRVRIRGLLAPVEELAATTPREAKWRESYESVRHTARLALRTAAPGVRDELIDPVLPAQPPVIWRCPDCGGLESPQPCIGVCIWRPTDWVRLDVFDDERTRALRVLELERSLRSFLARLAHVRPREGEWERNWGVFQIEARRLAATGVSELAADPAAR